MGTNSDYWPPSFYLHAIATLGARPPLTAFMTPVGRFVVRSLVLRVVVLRGVMVNSSLLEARGLNRTLLTGKGIPLNWIKGLARPWPCRLVVAHR